MYINEPRTAYQINIPDLPTDPYNFNFASTLPQGLFTFSFKFFNGVWNCWVLLPTGEIRQAGVYPNVRNWLGFFDYYIKFNTTLDSIGQNDLPNVTMVLYAV